MGLDTANLFVPFGVGLQSDVDDKLLPLGKVLELRNAQFTREGEVTKRYGTKVLPAPTGVNGQLGTHLGALVDTGVPLQTLGDPTSLAWTAVTGDTTAAGGARAGISVDLTKIASSAQDGDVAYGVGSSTGFFGVTYIDETNLAIVMWLIDAQTKHRAFEVRHSLSGGATKFVGHRVIFVANRFVLCTLNDLGVARFTTVVADTFATTTLTVASVGQNPATVFQCFDAIAGTAAGVVEVVMVGVAGNLVAVEYNATTNTSTTWTPQDNTAAAIPCDGAVCWVQRMNDGVLALETASAAQGLRVQWTYAVGGGAVRVATHTYVADAAFTGLTAYLTGHVNGGSALGDVLVIYSTASGIAELYRVKSATIAAGVTTFSGVTVARGACLASKSFVVLGEPYVVVARYSPTSGTNFLLHVGQAGQNALPPQSKIGVRSSNLSAALVPQLSAVAAVSTYQVALGLNYVTRYEYNGSPNLLLNAVQVAALTFPALWQGTPQSIVGRTVEAIGSLFAPGGAVMQYDGALFAEAGFAYQPEPPSFTPASSAGGGLTPASTYWYRYVYVYTDAQGRIWRSAPSVLFSAATAAVQGTLTHAVPTLRIAGRRVLSIEIYRGAAGIETLLQKAGTVANDINADTVPFVDTVSDGSLAFNEFLYTTGKVLANDTPPNFVSITEAQTRSWGISGDDPQVLWPSKEHTVGVGVEWSEAFAFDVRDAHGAMRALAQIDDKPIVFKGDALYFVAGLGPNNLGQGGSYAAQIFCNGIGCTNAQAICETRDGVIFRSTSSRAGFFLIDRGLTVTYIGAPVQRYNSEVITSCVFISSLIQARFFTVSGLTLVYDLVAQSWSVFTGQQCLTAASWNGVPAWISSATAHVLREDQTGAIFTDDGLSYTMLVTSPWVQINKYRGYERFYRAQLVGELTGTAPIFLTLTPNFAVGALATVSKATTAGILDREIRYSAKFGAVKISVNDGGSTAGRLKLSGMTLVMAVKKGLRPTADSNRLT